MKRIFSNSLTLILFVSAVSFVLTFGTALLEYIIPTQQEAQAVDNDGQLIFIVVALLTCILFLNATDIVSFWLRGKAQELKVKNMVGLPSVYIYLPLYLNFNLLIFLSFLIGVIAAVGCSFLFSYVITVTVSFLSCLCSFLFCTVFLNLFCMILLWHKLRRGYMEL